MKRKLGRFLWGVICLAIVCSCIPVNSYAANVTTVANIPQNTTAALNYLAQNVGTVNAKYTIPGLMQSVTRDSTGQTVTTCNGMVPQAIAFAGSGKYLLISAYCECGQNHRSVIYMLDGETKEYIVTLILDANMHAGGIAWDGTYIWVCDSASGKYLRAYKYASALNAVGHNYWTLYTAAICPVACTPSYLCYTNNYLYVGTFSTTATTANIYYYSVNDAALTQEGCFTINGISKIQGISIRGNAMVITSSYGRTNASEIYIFNDPVNKFKVSGITYNASNARFYSFANMVEGCYIGSTYTYFLFESGAKTYRESLNTRPLDQYIRYRSSDLGVIPICPHESTEIKYAKSATCTDTGYTGDLICTTCLEVITAGQTIPPLGHAFGAWVTDKAATCTQRGTENHTCSRCGATETRDVDALGHSYVATVTAPTCTESGYTTYQCARCSDVYTADYKDASGHAFNAWTTIQETTCTEKGQEIRTCSRCNAAETREISALGHNYTATVTVPTCTGQGYTTHTCTRCGDSYRDTYTSPLGHAWDSGTVTTEPTETTPGVMCYICTRCSAVRTEPIPELGHTHAYAASVVAPTCTAQGYTVHTCSCGDYYVDSYLAALGHAWDSGVVITEPTDTAPGIMRYTCTRCSITRAETIPALGHTHSYTITTVAPTCTEQGYTAHTCACGDSYIDSYIAALGHDWDNGIITIVPTETQNGIKIYTCNRCGQTKNTVIVATGCDGGETCPSVQFIDVDQAQWYHKAIDFAIVHGIFAGVDATHFNPNGKTTRAMFVAVLWRLDGKPDSHAQTPFADVNVSDYFAKAVIWAAENNVAAGIDPTHFNPNGSVTREQAAAFLYRYACMKGYNLEATADISKFPDASRVSAYAESNLSWAVGTGLISGTSSNGIIYLEPQGSATRAQVAQMLMKFQQNIAK